ncbi:MAG TPA: hypothetical protein VHY56_09985 [Candidatus Binataceae bacterium]|nr:hypothetical protein [Candidatus Binataceae bacterium]
MIGRLAAGGHRRATIRAWAHVKAWLIGALHLAPVLLLTAVALIASGCGGDSSGSPAPAPFVHFVPNSHAFWSNRNNWTTAYGPAYANIVVEGDNFVPCRGGPYALCYYSGPESASENLSCTLTPDGLYANCNCYDIPYGVYFVDINAILNHSVYENTIAQCRADGSLCQTVNSAPVCQSVNQGTLIPNAKMFSTFSFDCIPTNGIGQTSCGTAPYAGCMTAPCVGTGTPGIVNCSCPTYSGPYQVGQNEQACSLGDDLVWSAAYALPSPSPTPTPEVSTDDDAIREEAPSAAASTAPSPTACVPDAPGGYGCPLYTDSKVLPPGSGVDCTKVCDEYKSCKQAAGVQTGYTCDATLCTDECTDRNLLGPACSALAKCDISEIAKAESAASCSCCASQLCKCSPNEQTNKAIYQVNQAQRDLSITPQCDINQTLCGSP